MLAYFVITNIIFFKCILENYEEVTLLLYYTVL